MKKAFFTLALTFVAFTANAQSNLKGDMNDDGEKNITDVMLLVDEILNGSNPKSYLTCPDDNHPHMIDLGLPSGTKWACCNIGADKPEDYGGYYAWGETEEKSVYNDVTYLYSSGVDENGDGNYDDYHNDIDTYGVWQNLGNYKGEDEDGYSIYDFAGSQYDVAHVRWSGPWVMPSSDQIEELVNSCTYEWTKMNGVDGMQFTGPSGGTIFLPAAGAHYYVNLGDYLEGADFYTDHLVDAGFCGDYWSSTQNQSGSYGARTLYFDPYEADCGYGSRDPGFTVRPVSR